MLPRPSRATEVDRLWGIERHPGSEYLGEVVAPVVTLWDNPMVRHFAVAVAEHDEPCVIVGRYEHPTEDRTYYLVRPARAEWVGWGRRLRGFVLRDPIQGWVSAPFLLNQGKA
jgi:hypothetical protein